MPKPDLKISSESLSQAIGPLNVLKQAISKVPALKYALGVAGIAAAIAIIKTLVTDLKVALFGIILVLVLMTVLFTFAKLTAIGSREVKLAAISLLWSSLLLTIASASFLFASVFFDWPINLKHLISGETSDVGLPKKEKTDPEVTYLRGVVRDIQTKQGVVGAVIELVELLPGKLFTTSSEGGFSIEEVPANIGDGARVYVTKEGYKLRDEYVTLPGPKTIYLEKHK